MTGRQAAALQSHPTSRADNRLLNAQSWSPGGTRRKRGLGHTFDYGLGHGFDYGLGHGAVSDEASARPLLGDIFSGLLAGGGADEAAGEGADDGSGEGPGEGPGEGLGEGPGDGPGKGMGEGAGGGAAEVFTPPSAP